MAISSVANATPFPAESFGSLKAVVADITFNNAYAAGGDPLTAADLGLPDSMELVFVSVAPAAGYVFEYVYSTGKVKAYESAAAGNPLAEVGQADLANVTTRVLALAR